MLENFLNAWRVPDLRTKLLFTAAMLAVYRLGSHLPAPAVNPNAINVGGSSFLNLLNTFSGGGLSRLSIFALGIMPYITASIILQVMTPVFPSLQALQKEGELTQGQEATAKRAVGDKADAKLAHGRQDLHLDIAGPQ